MSRASEIFSRADTIEIGDENTRDIVWLDLETTGLDPWKYGDTTLEVAAVITNFWGDILTPEPYHAIVKHSDAELLRSRSNEVVQKMHDKSGLWDKLADGKPREVVEKELLEFIKDVVPMSYGARLGGNSVSLDRKFLESEFPSVEAHLHYRIVDNSSLAFIVENLYGLSFHKELRHEAYSDIMESIDEYKWLMKFFRDDLFF